ncbi:MAG: ATP-binding protein [Pseudomonadota bacterium]
MLTIGIAFTPMISFGGGLIIGLGSMLWSAEASDSRLLGYYIVLAGLFFCFSSTGSMINQLVAKTEQSPLTRNITGIVIGILFSVVGLVFIASIAFMVDRTLTYWLGMDSRGDIYLASAINRGLLLGGMIGTALYFHSQQLRSALFYGLTSMIIITLIMQSVWWTADAWQSLPYLAPRLDNIAHGLEATLLLIASFSVSYWTARWLASIAAGLISGVLFSSGIGIYLIFSQILEMQEFAPFYWSLAGGLLGLTWHWWQMLPMYLFSLVWDSLLYQLEQRRVGAEHSLFHRHSVCKYDRQKIPLPNLDQYLLWLYEHYPDEAPAAFTYVSATEQAGAARAAQIELDARHLEACDTVDTIALAHQDLAAGELSGPASSLLRSLSRISQDTSAALSQSSRYHQRLALQNVEERLDGLSRELLRSDELYAKRFRPVVDKWRLTVTFGLDQYTRTQHDEEMDNPYIIAVPLGVQQEIFVGRKDISQKIERFILRQPCPPLLLYGQRRMGKTSLLKNLTRLLPSNILPLLIDLQSPVSSAKSTENFFTTLAEEMCNAAQEQGRELPVVEEGALAADPVAGFNRWLGAIEDALPDTTILLNLDEFIALDKAFSKGQLDEDSVLGFLRHLIQHRPRFKILLSGSHTLPELKHWASYLINVRTIYIGYLQPDEARHLIEQPVIGFQLRYHPDAIQRIIHLTRSHPYLIQLLCSTVVTIKNEQPVSNRYYATVEDVEEAIPEALEDGYFFFTEIEEEQVSQAGLNILKALAARGEGGELSELAITAMLPVEAQIGDLLQKLMQRELIEPVVQEKTAYRFQIELIRRWFEVKR